MAIRTVAVHSEVDAHALHVEMADEAYAIGGPRPADSYLRGDSIIEVAKACGAEAIHPGYGFLSENEDFARAVEKAGLVFIGPTPEAIEQMGLKDRAKAIMEKAGVPVVPGYHGENQDDEIPRRAGAEGRLPAAGESRGRRRRQGHAPGHQGRRVRRAARRRAPRGEERLWRRPRAARALRAGPAPHRVPGLRRHARPLRAPLRARVLDPAPPPEGARGNALALPRRRDAREDGRGRGRRARARSGTAARAPSSSSPAPTASSSSWR